MEDKRRFTRSLAWSQATKRNWGLYLLRGWARNLHFMKKLLPEPDYNRLENSIRWAIMELENQYRK